MPISHTSSYSDAKSIDCVFRFSTGSNPFPIADGSVSYWGEIATLLNIASRALPIKERYLGHPFRMERKVVPYRISAKKTFLITDTKSHLPGMCEAPMLNVTLVTRRTGRSEWEIAPDIRYIQDWGGREIQISILN